TRSYGDWSSDVCSSDLLSLQNIRKVSEDPLCKESPRLRIIGIKTYLDGGMLTGSAYMRQPWGVSKIYSINDPEYRGVLQIPRDQIGRASCRKECRSRWW